jgi:fatty-acyl-CoA synthase
MTDAGIGSWLTKRSARSPSSTVLRFEGEDISYAEFDTSARDLAQALALRGIEHGSRVAYLGDNHPSFLETLFASAFLGAIFVPLNTRLTPPELAYALADSGATVLVYAEILGETARAAAGAAEVETLLAIEEFGQVYAEADAPSTGTNVTLDDPAMILYTSGTTGKPKGAVLTHGNLLWNSLNVLIDYDVASTERALMVSPLFHVASLGMGALPIILKGATVVLERRFVAERVLSLIADEHITWISGVPTTFQLLCDSPEWASTDLSSLRSLTCGGSPVPRRVIEAYESRGLSFTSGYGMTEASPGVTCLSPDASRAKAGTAGQPHFFTRVRIASPDALGIGEIEVSGPNVTAGYWNRPEETAAAFSPDGWFRSGDLGSLDADGFLTVSDRLKDMVISGGENVYPAEVELVIAELEGVTGVAVIGTADEKWGEVPIAVVTISAGSTIGDEQVRRHLDGRLARYKIPARIFFADELPRTASGKVFKSKLRELYANRPDEGI